MSVLSTLVGGFYTIQLKDKTYKVPALLTKDMCAQFELWLFQRAVTSLKLTEGLYTEEEFDKKRDQLSKQFQDGQFAFKSIKGVKALKTIPGIAQICALLINVDENEILPLLAESQGEVGKLLNVILENSFHDIMEMSRRNKKEKHLKKRKLDSTLTTCDKSDVSSDTSTPFSSIGSTSDLGKLEG